jgi:hypothetical protein
MYGWEVRRSREELGDAGAEQDAEAISKRTKAALAGGKGMEGARLEVLDRLHAKSYIFDSKSKAKSVWMSDEGTQRARELFERHFARKF